MIRRRRPAVSEIMATLLMIAITLVAGAAVFGWVNGQAGISENALGQNTVKQVDYLQESFVIVSVQFAYYSGGVSGPCVTGAGGTYCNEVSISVYNNGAVGLTISSITFSNSTWKSASGTVVPALSVLLTLPTPTSAYYKMTYTCGTTSGGPITQGAAAPTQPVAQESVPPTVYAFVLPGACSTSSSILDGASYTVQALGYYGNVVTAQATANG